MEKRLSYFDMAGNDYVFLKYNYDAGMVGNAMTYIAQNICERFLKHAIDLYCNHMDTTAILHTYSLKALRNFIRQNLPDFACSWNDVIKADGYYFSARYPGDDSFIVTPDDIKDCWDAVSEARTAVMQYLQEHEK